MLYLTEDAIAAKGLLGAVVATSTAYLRGLFASHFRDELDEPPRTIVHRGPHIDEYFAEMLFRASTVGGDQLPEFQELPLHSETDDHLAEHYWPGSAVFGMGDRPQLRTLPLHLFDEHAQTGGRRAASCLSLVLRERYASTPPSIAGLVEEIDKIDSSGGAHAQHLGNSLKTMHGYRFFMGRNDQNDRVQRALDAHWKWALVNGLIASTIWAIDKKIAFRTTEPMLSMLERFKDTNPLRDEHDLGPHIDRARKILVNAKALSEQAVLDVGGRQIRQDMLVPYVAAAATEAFGEEVAYFLIEPFIEADIAGQISFERLQSLVTSAMQSFPPAEVHEADVSITPWIVKGCRFYGRKQEWGGKSSAAPTQSNLWILYCSSDGTVMKTKQALDNYLVKHNFGVGMVLTEDRTEGTKALFRCRFLDEQFFDAVVDRIRRLEPDYWYRVQPTAPYILNGNATHMYVPKSSLTHWSLDRICRDVYRIGRVKP